MPSFSFRHAILDHSSFLAERTRPHFPLHRHGRFDLLRPGRQQNGRVLALEIAVGEERVVAVLKSGRVRAVVTLEVLQPQLPPFWLWRMLNFGRSPFSKRRQIPCTCRRMSSPLTSPKFHFAIAGQARVGAEAEGFQEDAHRCCDHRTFNETSLRRLQLERG